MAVEMKTEGTSLGQSADYTVQRHVNDKQVIANASPDHVVAI